MRSGIAVAVKTKNPFNEDLVEIDAAPSIRWKDEPKPPQIVVACTIKDRQDHFPIVKEAKTKVDDDFSKTLAIYMWLVKLR